MPEKRDFSKGDLVVYPTHGVGKIVGVETQEIAGHRLSLFVVHFDKDRMTLRVPLGKAKLSGLRRLSTRKEMDAALTRLKGRSRVKRTMWSRRAQEYEAKINSGNPASIAEVVRDLYRNVGQPEQSYSERQIYQAAMDRLVREFAAVEKIDEDVATKRLEQILSVGVAPPGGVSWRMLCLLAIARSSPRCGVGAAFGRWPRFTANPFGWAASSTASRPGSTRAIASSFSATIWAMAPMSAARSTG